MNFLPIVMRELRLAARKGATFWIRIAAALLTVLIGLGFLLVGMLTEIPPNAVGSGLFSLLTWLAFPVAALAGVFFTSDCLSEEKREGTLGLLFLTDLRGHDVVLGKLVSGSLRSAYGLLATFPIVALALIMGGVTGGQFGRTALALLLTMAFSLSTGLCLSSLCRDGRQAMGSTLLVLVLAGGATLMADAAVAQFNNVAFQPWFSWVSPLWLFTLATTGGQPFWLCAAVCAGLSLALLTVACWVTPRSWQDNRRASATSQQGLLYAFRFGTAKTRAERRRKLLPVNPLLWFCSRLRWRGLVVNTALITATLATGVLLGWRELHGVAAGVGLGASYVLAWVLYFWMASEAARFFVESRHNGALELLLATPLTGPEVVRGVRGSLWRLFRAPMVLLTVLQLCGSLALILSLRASQADARLLLAPLPFVGVGGGLFHILTRAADLIAIAWVGVWMGLTARNASFAVLKTLLFVQVLPGLASMFLSPILMVFTMFLTSGPRGEESGWMVLSLIAADLLWIGKDLIFIRWASTRLETDLRILAVPESARVWSAPAPPVLAPT